MLSDRGLNRAISILAEAVAPGGASGASGAELEASQVDQVRTYLLTLLLWRERFALIATADPVLIVQHHVVDSLHLVPHLRGRARLADIGSGAGFPGVPLAIAMPELQVSLIESRRKKASFLREVRRAAGLKNLEVVERRAEALADQSFDAVASRALGSVEDFLKLASSLLCRDGVAIAMRGREGANDAVSHADFAPARVLSYGLAHGRERALLIYRRL